MVRSMAALVKQYSGPVRLVIVGGESDEPDPEITPEIGRLQTIVKELGIEAHVTFVGRKSRDQLKYYYSAADVFVTTPWYEQILSIDHGKHLTVRSCSIPLPI